MNKQQLSERDICSKYITPAFVQAGWHLQTQIREEFSLTKGRAVNEHAWKLSVEELAKRNYNLDCKNPHQVAVEHRDPDTLMADYQALAAQLTTAQQALKAELMSALTGDLHE